MRQLLETLLLVATIVGGGCLAAAARDACLPEDVKLGAAAPSAARAQYAALPPPHGTAMVYLDDSLSMRGFVDPRGGQPATFADTIVGLRPALEQVVPGNRIFFNSFGANITPLPVTGLLAPTSPNFYICDRAHRDGCETRIDKVLNAVANSDNDTLSILETDLFLSEQDMVGSEYGTMRNSFEHVLLSGKSVGILGIRAPFYGKIYDIPGRSGYEAPRNTSHRRQGGTRAGESVAAAAVPAAATTSYFHHGDRPFFLLIMAGDDDQILRFRSIIEQQLPPGESDAGHHFVLFTLHPARPADRTVPAPPLLNPADGKPIPIYARLPLAPDGLPVVELTAKNPPTVRQQADEFRESNDTQPLAKFVVSELTLWAARDNIIDCQSGRWKQWHQPGLITASDDAAADLVLRFDKSGLRSMPSRPFTFLVHAKMEATGVKGSPALTGWLHEWGFGADPEDVDRLLRRRPRLFPVLNLGQLGDTLAGIVSSDFKPVTVADYLFAFQKAD